MSAGNILGVAVSAFGYNLIFIIFLIISIIRSRKGKKWLPFYIIGLVIQGFSYYGSCANSSQYSSSYASYANSYVSIITGANIIVTIVLAIAAGCICCSVHGKKSSQTENKAEENKEDNSDRN